MAWDERVGSIHYHYVGNDDGVVDMDGPFLIGDLVDLTQDGHEFRVEIADIADEPISGRVQVIGPEPSLEACGIRKGEVVTFCESNIQGLHRRAGV